MNTYVSKSGVTLFEPKSKRVSHMPIELRDILISKMIEIDPTGFAKAYTLKDAKYLTGLCGRAMTALKIREKTNRNDGVMVEMIQKVGGGQKGWAWCAYHGQACVGIAEILTGKVSPLPWSGSCAEIRKLAPKAMQIPLKDIEFGDQIVKRYTDTGLGHYATVDHELVEGVSFAANEGNTTAGRVEDKVIREGGGAYYTERKIHDADGNWIMALRCFDKVTGDAAGEIPVIVPKNPPIPAAEPTGIPQFGEISDRVITFQNALNRYGASLNPDGKFGKLTKAACAKFQKEHGLKGTGIPGPKTMALLEGASSTSEAVQAKNQGSTKSPDFKFLWETCIIDADRKGEVAAVCARIRRNQSTYQKIADIVGCEWEMVGLLHYRESSALTLDVYLHNGQKLGKPTTIVPKGVFFRKDQFIEASVDAMKAFRGVRDIPAFLALAEKFNGLGYRNKGIYSPYIFAATNHSSERGKYIADGVWSATAVEKQLGVAAILRGLRS